MLLLLLSLQGGLAQFQGPVPSSRPPTACSLSQATCANGQCIDRAAICDSVRDCSDGSDESGCRDNDACEPNEYQCDNKKCVLKTWRCDGDDDCGDKSDETLCQPNPPGSPCRYYEWQCASQDQCIPKSFHCDGEKDCMDNSDEAGCRPPEIVVSPPALVTVDQSFTFIINCTAVGVPTPQVVWRLNWGHVPGKCRMTSDGREGNRAYGELTCPQATASDQGAYSCEAINSQGSCFAGSAGCGQPGQDAILVVDTATGPCSAGSFSIGAAAGGERGGDCLRCWCSDRTDSCQGADLRLSTLPPPQGIFQLVEISPRMRGSPRVVGAARGAMKSLPSGQTIQASTSSLGLSGTPYFSLPSSYTGSLLRSYGLSLRFTTSYRGSGPPLSAPLVVLQGGGGASLSYSPSTPLLPGVRNRVEVRLWPGDWRDGEGGQVDREELLRVLSGVERLLIRAQHVEGGRLEVTVEEIELEVGEAGGRGETVDWVEQCNCPPGYTGLSCEVCAPGFSLERGECREQGACSRGTYRPLGGGGCQTCPCPLTNPSNQFANECYLDQDSQVTCRCKPGYTGRRCGQCSQGWQGNPALPGGDCRQGSPCSSSGSLSSQQDPTTGRCRCRAGWAGDRCEYPELSGQCRPYQFLSTEPARPGCINCFCAGIPTGVGQTPCKPSRLYRDQIRAVFQEDPQDFSLVDASLEQTIPTDQLSLNSSSKEVSYARFSELADDIYHWRLPAQFLGNRLSSYGGFLNFTLRYVPRPGREDKGDGEALVELLGNDIRLVHYSEAVEQDELGHRYSVPWQEGAWERLDRPGSPANREHLLMALAGLEYILVKAAHSERTREAAIADVRMDSGSERPTGRQQATAVEECVCPPGYQGLSCDRCAPGYTRSGGGLYLGTCQPCQCNGKSGSCDPTTGLCLDCRDQTTGRQCQDCLPGYTKDYRGGCLPTAVDGSSSSGLCDPRGSLGGGVAGECRCKSLVEGARCDSCQPGSFGLSPSLASGCLSCHCSGVTDECTDARLFWSTLRVPMEPSHGFQLTDARQRQDKRSEVTFLAEDGGRNTQLAYTYSPGDSQVYYWSLPRQFLGNRLTAYMGNMTISQRFTARSPAGLPLRDDDVIMTGNGVSVGYRQSPSSRMAGVEQRLVVPTMEEGWTHRDTGGGVDREQFLRLLSDLESVLVRATVVRDMDTAFLRRVTMDIAVPQATGGPLVRGAEECRCPAGYRGLSCEQCSPGYYRDSTDRSQGPLGRCVSCPCNGNEDSCQEAASSGGVECLCKDGWAGRTCADRGGPASSAPPIIVTVSEPRIHIVELGTTVRFNCRARPGPEAQGQGLSLQWARQSGLLPQGRARDDGLGLLVITQVQSSDSGTYVCTATAGQFVVSQTKELQVAGGRGGGRPGGQEAGGRWPGGQEAGGRWPGGQEAGDDLVVMPEDAVVSLGDSVTLTCRGAGVPRWGREGGVLPPSSSQSQGVLTLLSAGPADSGLYVCRGEAGQTRQARLTVLDYRAPPAVTVTPDQQTVGQGEDAEMVCEGLGDPRPSLAWSKVGEELTSPRLSVQGGVLKVRGSAVSDRGMYVCTATSAGGSARASSVLEVEPREAPRLELYPQASQTVSAGGSVLFQCRAVAGIPSPTLVWSREDGARLAANAELLAGGVIRITQVSGPEAGNYRCVAENSAGRAETVARLDISRPPSVRLQPAGSLQLQLGQPLTLRCLASGDPQPTVTWRKVGAEGLQEVSSGQEVLEVAAVRREDEGTYSCLASSTAGEVEERVQVLVLEGDDGGWGEGGGSQGGWSEGGQWANNSQVWLPGSNGGAGGAPRVRDFVVGAGNDVRLEADVVGELAGGVTIIWSREDGRPIPGRHVQRGSVLYIRTAQGSDAGLYVCRGSDGRGTELFRFLANLVIAAAPEIRLEPKQQTVRPGDSPSITCLLLAGDEPVDIQWTRESAPQLPSSVSQRGPVLQFRSIAVSDQGRYVCRAANRAGVSTSVADVVVNDAGGSWEGESESLRFSQGDTVDLPCRLPAGSPVEWRREGGQLPAGHQLVRTALRISRVRAEDSGRYVCTSQGRRQYVDVTVTERVTSNPDKPTISIQPSADSYREGDSLEVECAVGGLRGRGKRITWDRIGGEMPPSVQARGGSLRSSSLGPDSGALYRCKVETRQGTFYEDFLLTLTG